LTGAILNLECSLINQFPHNKGRHKIKPLYETYYCQNCGEPLTERQVSVLLCRNRNNGKHPKIWACSNKCANILIGKQRVGYHHSEETKKKIGLKRSGENCNFYGNAPWNEGIPMRPESREKLKKNAHIMRGENHPQWRGGKSFEKYGKGWKQVRCDIRYRDNHQCQLCGKKEIKRHFDVHHIDYDKKNLDPNNLITLCNGCHMKTSFNREQWISMFKTLQLIRIMIYLRIKRKSKPF